MTELSNLKTMRTNSNKGSLSRIQMKFIIIASCVAVSITSFFTFLFVLMQGQNGELRNFFSAQAKAILNGSFEVDSHNLPGECYIFQGKCIGYFGITPSLFRIPLLILGRNFGFTSSSVITAITLGITASTLILYQMSKILGFWNSKKQINPMANYALILIVICPGSVFLQLTRPSAFWEAISWGSTLTLFGLFFVLKWYQDSIGRNLFVALSFFTLAANARITHGLIAFVIGMICLYQLRRLHRGTRKLQYFLAAAITVLPITTSLLVLYAKFHTFFPNLFMHEQVPEAAHWSKILEINGGKSVGMTFFLTNFFTYLRPDSMALNQLDLVSLRPTYMPITNLFPLPRGGMYNEPSLSITNVTPISVMMVIYVCLISLKIFSPRTEQPDQESDAFKFTRALSFSSLAGLVITLTFVASSNRYLGDFIPASVMFAILGSIMFMKSKKYNEDKSYSLFLVMLVSIGVFSNVLSAITRARLGIL